jgi:GLPGLI family protein
MEDVYICFYTDDITISGGPCSINGLPGDDFRLTIPRLYTSYVATKVDVSVSDVATIKPITAKNI